MCILCQNPKCLINHCTPEWQQKIIGSGRMPVYPKGQNIFMEGSLVMGAYFVLKGKVKIISSNLNGKAQTVRLAKEGHILGHTAIGPEKYCVGAVTLEDSEICFVDNQTLQEAFLENPKFTFEVMQFYSKELRKSEIRTKCFAMMNNEEKVILGLLYIADTYIKEVEANFVTINLNRQEIAQIIGTNPEQVSRVLTTLKKDRLIDLKERAIIVKDITALKELISQYCFALEC